MIFISFVLFAFELLILFVQAIRFAFSLLKIAYYLIKFAVYRKHPLWAAGAAVARGARIIPANGRRTRAAASPPAVAAIFPAGLKISR